MPTVVDKDGSWTADFSNPLEFDFTGSEGPAVLNIAGDDYKIDSTMSVGGVTIGDDENHVTVGGGSQKFGWNGKLSFGKTTVNLVGGSVDLGNGRTDSFQIDFTVDHEFFGPRFTGVGTNDLKEKHKFKTPDHHIKKSLEKDLPVLKCKHPLFDIAGIIIPFAKFFGWVVNAELKVKLSAEIDDETEITVDRTLHVEVRPLFIPWPEITWPEFPPPPPWLDAIKIRIQNLTRDLLTNKALIKFIDDTGDEITKYRKYLEIAENVTKVAAAVATATAALIIAVATAAAFLEMNPIADAAEVVAGTTLATESAELVAVKAAQKTAEGGLKWGANKLTSSMIKKQVLGTITAALALSMAGTAFNSTEAGAQAEAKFNQLAQEFGLNSTGDDLAAVQNCLSKMRERLSSAHDATQNNITTGNAELITAAEVAHKSSEYRLLIESWRASSTGPSNAPYLTWANMSLKSVDASDVVETLNLGDISNPQLLAATVKKQESYAKEKNHAAFVMNMTQKKASFWSKAVNDLLGSLEQSGNMVTYIRAEKIPMQVLVDRWGAISGANQR